MLVMDFSQVQAKPAKRPDFNPLDFFAWGYIRSKVFKHMPANFLQLINMVRREINNLEPERITRVH